MFGSMCLSEYIAPFDFVSDANATVASPAVTAWKKMGSVGAKRLLAFVKVNGNAVDDEDIVVTVQKASDAGGTGAAAVKSITVPAHATANDNGVIMVDVGMQDLDQDKPFFRVHVAGDDTGHPILIAVIAGDLRYAPGDEAANVLAHLRGS